MTCLARTRHAISSAWPRNAISPGAPEIGTSREVRFNSDRDPLDDVPGHLLLRAIVEVGRPRVRVPQQVLDLLSGHLLPEQVRRRGRPERVAAERSLGQPSRLEPPLDDPQEVVAVQPPIGQLTLLLPCGAEQGGLVGPSLEPRCLGVGLHLDLQVVPYRDLVELAALLPE